MLTHLGLNLNQSIRQMSKGMKEKVQLVLTMSRKAKLYLLDEVIFLNQGKISLHESCDEIRETRGQSVDALFREVFKCWEN